MNASARKGRKELAAFQNDERVRDEERAGAKILASTAERAHERLLHLYEISKQLTRFETIARTVPAVLGLVSESVPLRIAILMLAQGEAKGAGTRAIVWHSEDVSPTELQAATAHAKGAYAYLVHTMSPVEEETGTGRLPSTPPPSGQRGAFVLLPLVVERRQIFGALQIEGAASLDEVDLAFMNAVVNQLAIALDRASVIESRQASAKAGRAAAEFLSETSAKLFSSLEYATTVAAVVRAAVPPLADVCWIDEVDDDGHFHCTSLILSDPGLRHLADRIRQLAPDPASRTHQALVFRAGESVLLTDARSAAHESAHHEHAHADLLQELGVDSIMIVPLLARGRAIGVLTFVAAGSGRRYSASDLGLAEEIGRRAAIAIDNAQLYEYSQRAMQARQDLLAIVAHDMRNPLNSIVMSAQLLRDPSCDDVRRAKYVEMIERSAHRMDRIIADLLDIASIEAGHLTIEVETHAVAPLVREVVDGQQSLAAQKAVRLESVFTDEAMKLECDRGRVHQVFGNIIGNAIKFSPNGGTITVSAERRGAEMLFSVADTGPGIEAAERPKP